MKTWQPLCLGVILLGCIIGCNTGNTKQTTDNETDSTLVEMKTDVSVATAAKMDSLLQTYYQLKDALVEGDSAAVPGIAGDLLEKTIGISSEDVTDTDKKAAVQRQRSQLKTQLETLQQPEDLATQRAGFEKVSAVTYALIKTVGLKDVTVYRTFCPMAFDDKGAYWLSEAAAVRNPYFGHQMINCGWVKETLQF